MYHIVTRYLSLVKCTQLLEKKYVKITKTTKTKVILSKKMLFSYLQHALTHTFLNNIVDFLMLNRELES